MLTKDWSAGRKTCSHENQFHFVCPIFSARVSLRSCLQLRDQYWIYGRPYEKRKGCQACMASSKCPALVVLNEIMHRGGDPYYSNDPTMTGTLDDSVYKRINRVVIMDHHIAKYGVDGAELALINAANEKSRNGVDLKTGRKGTAAPLGVVENPSFRREPPPERKIEASSDQKVRDTINTAVTGDMSAAINAAMEKNNG